MASAPAAEGHLLRRHSGISRPDFPRLAMPKSCKCLERCGEARLCATSRESRFKKLFTLPAKP
jgi:hypothetical protein